MFDTGIEKSWPKREHTYYTRREDSEDQGELTSGGWGITEQETHEAGSEVCTGQGQRSTERYRG